MPTKERVQNENRTWQSIFSDEDRKLQSLGPEVEKLVRGYLMGMKNFGSNLTPRQLRLVDTIVERLMTVAGELDSIAQESWD